MAVHMLPPAAYADILPSERIEKRGRKRAALAIGAIIVLSDGSECQIVGYDKQGQPLCAPLQP